MSNYEDQSEACQSENDVDEVLDSPSVPSAPQLVRMDTVLSVGGGHYDVLPLPSPGFEELDGIGITFVESDMKSIIPYSAIYNTPRLFEAGKSSVFLMKTKVICKVTDVKRDVNIRHPLNPHLYTMEVSHGQFSWTIHKRYKHFVELHEKLWAYRTSLKIPIPLRKHKDKRKSRRKLPKNESKIPWFPRKPDVLVSSDELNKRKDQLERYLNAMLESRLYRSQSITKKFLEVSRVSFIEDLGVKGKEGIIKKRSGGHKIRMDFCAKCCHLPTRELFRKWDSRWFVIKDTFVAYLDPNQGKIKGVLLFDRLIKILHHNPSAKIVISNSSRRLKVNCWTDRQALEWKNSLQNCIDNHSAGLTDTNIRFQSFAPQREASLAHWFVDGRTYFDALADAMEDAQEEILIADWWLSPEIYLKRPITNGDYWRLDMLLKRKAEEGVKVYVQLYKEVEVAVGLDSAYTKRTLMKLHRTNIKVMRHPDLTPGESLLWAHHEKLVIVDQVIAFVGGIDLCYGRWDDQDHRLTDVGSTFVCHATENFTAIDGPTNEGRPDSIEGKPTTTGMAFSMFGAMSMGVVTQVSKDQVPSKDIISPQRPENIDLKEGNKLKRFLTKVRKDPTSSAINHKKLPSATEDFNADKTSVEETEPLFQEKQKYGFTRDSADGGKAEEGKSRNKSAPMYLEKYKEMANLISQSTLWVGKDYNNFILKDLSNLDDPFEDDINRSEVARMPWHDIACVTYGKAARDVARHFIQRWNFTKIQKAKKAEHISFILPKSYKNDLVQVAANRVLPGAVEANVQIVRSSYEWSAGISQVDSSIQNAYLYAIQKSEHFIYIENQFFISCRGDPLLRNSITEALFHRILRAHHNNKNFKVYIVMPLVPGFEGDISDQKKSQAIRAILHWQYKSINRGTGSLLEDLNQAMGQHNTSKYISFCGLRTHSKLNGKRITEIVYVHSKMLIVDDKITIIGSANINDRSLTGQRDSEMAMIVEDTQFVSATLDGKKVEVGRYGASLRRRCFCEHLGLLPVDYDGTNATFDPLSDESASVVEDIVSDHFFKEVWTTTAAINTTVYEKVFKCVPSDFIRELSQIHDFQKEPLCEVNGNAADKELTKIKGHLVLLPLRFLIDEDLTPVAMTKEAIAPTELWT